MTLEGRVALVTGASEGIGRGIALALGEAGAKVVVVGRRPEPLDEVRAEIERRGGKALGITLDVTDVETIRRARDLVAERFGRVAILVNDAAYSVNRPVWEITEDDWDQVVETGPKATFFCSQIFGADMREAGYGKVINLSSTLSRGLSPGASVYGMSKAAISYLTMSLASEWASAGIRVNAIAPASTPTPSRLENMTPERKAALVARIPLGRLGMVEDIVPMALYLAGPESDFVTGQTFFVDGGWTVAN